MTGVSTVAKDLVTVSRQWRTTMRSPDGYHSFRKHYTIRTYIFRKGQARRGTIFECSPGHCLPRYSQYVDDFVPVDLFSIPFPVATLVMSMDSESDIETDASSIYTSRSSATSYEADQSMRSSSPVSVISINSTTQFFKHEHGRRMNNYSDIYQLPADTEELERLGTSGIANSYGHKS